MPGAKYHARACIARAVASPGKSGPVWRMHEGAHDVGNSVRAAINCRRWGLLRLHWSLHGENLEGHPRVALSTIDGQSDAARSDGRGSEPFLPRPECEPPVSLRGQLER